MAGLPTGPKMFIALFSFQRSSELLCLWNRNGHAECLESLPSKALPLLQETSTLGPYQLTLLPGATTTNKLQKS